MSRKILELITTEGKRYGRQRVTVLKSGVVYLERDRVAIHRDRVKQVTL